MKISIIVLSLIFFAGSAASADSADSTDSADSAGNFEFALGAGHEYGGLIGGQFAYKTEYSKYYASLGFFGYSTGFQTTFSKNSKHAYGVTVGAEAIDSEEGFLFATYNYHFKGFSNNGFVIGTGIGFTKGDGINLACCDFDSPSAEKKAMVTLNIGYKF